MTSASVTAVILAAGGSRRFGSPKQLAIFQGLPLLQHAIAAARGSTAAEVVLVLGAHASEIGEAVDRARVRTVLCAQWPEGQAASLRVGIGAVGEDSDAVILLGDQPLVRAPAIDAVIAGRRPGALAVRATYGGRSGHPVLIDRRLFPAVMELSGDKGARELFDRVEVREVPCDGLARPTDVDTVAALRRLQSRHEARRGHDLEQT